MKKTLFTDTEVLTTDVKESYNKQRIDHYLAQIFPQYSRSFFHRIIKSNNVTVNMKIANKSGLLIFTNDKIKIILPTNIIPSYSIEDTNKLNVTIIFQNNDFMIINKPAGLLVHAPHKKSTTISLVDWLVTHIHTIKNIGQTHRPGIIHRLDKDTSGIMIIPLTHQANAVFGDLFKQRKINKIYYAVVTGHPERSGEINLALGRHKTIRNKITHVPNGRVSKTFYSVIEYFKNTTLLKIQPLTGRTHQIRVHCATIGHELIGDNLYGKNSPLINRHALHAAEISFTFDNQNFNFHAPLPHDFQQLIDHLKI